MRLFRSRNTQEIQPAPEMHLLLKCARMQIDDETTARIQELAAGEIDWARMHQLARRHRMLPLLYRSLYTTCPELIPVEVLDQLRLAYHANAARNMDLTEKLLKILELFKQRGIDVIPFKGPILAVSVYGDVALRMMSDLDLFVRKENVQAANYLLCSQGFQPEYPLEGFVQNINLQGPGACHFVGGMTNIDLHWEIAPRIFTYDFDSDGYWSRLDSVSIDRKELRVLSMEDRLLMLCGHGVRNAWKQLVWLCDIAEIIPHISQAEWRQVSERARSFGNEDILHFGLSLASNLLEAALPKNIQSQIQSQSTNGKLVHRVRRRLIRETGWRFSGPGWLRFQLRVRQSFIDKARFLWHLTITPNVDDLVRIQLPSWLSFLYIFHRVFRLVDKYVTHPRVNHQQRALFRYE